MESSHVRKRESIGTQPASARVIQAVAAAEGVDATDVTPPLFDAVDPDALDALFAREDGSEVRVEFAYCGYQVVVEGQDGVSVVDRDD